jgi:ribosomal protein L3 glutamine methyltransferase
MSAETEDLLTIQDWVRWGGCRFNEAGLHFGHGTDNAFDESAWLVGHALGMPPEKVGDYAQCRLTSSERETVASLLARRVEERRPAAYLTGSTWFAGLQMLVSDQVMVPRSPMAELIIDGFSPWADPARVSRVLDLCAGSGCIGIAAAVYLPDADVDLADISPAALRVAMRNRALHGMEERVRIIESDLFAAIDEGLYDVIVSNPPYVAATELESLPAEYRHEPELAFAAGESGLDLVLRILRDAPDFLTDDGLLIVEVGNTAAALQDCFPELSWTWLEFERGGDGVFVMRRQELVDAHAAFAEAVAMS